MEGSVRSAFARRDSGCQRVSGFLDGERGSQLRNPVGGCRDSEVRVRGVADNTVKSFPPPSHQ